MIQENHIRDCNIYPNCMYLKHYKYNFLKLLFLIWFYFVVIIAFLHLSESFTFEVKSLIIVPSSKKAKYF